MNAAQAIVCAAHSGAERGTYLFDFYACAHGMQRVVRQYTYDKDGGDGCLCVASVLNEVRTAAALSKKVTAQRCKKTCIDAIDEMVKTKTPGNECCDAAAGVLRGYVATRTALLEMYKGDAVARAWVERTMPDGDLAGGLQTSAFDMPTLAYRVLAQKYKEAPGVRVYTEDEDGHIVYSQFIQTAASKQTVQDDGFDVCRLLSSMPSVVFERDGHYDYVCYFNKTWFAQFGAVCAEKTRSLHLSMNAFQSMAMWMLADGDTTKMKTRTFYQQLKACYDKFSSGIHYTQGWPARIGTIELLYARVRYLVVDACEYTKRVTVCIRGRSGASRRLFCVNEGAAETGFVCHVYEQVGEFRFAGNQKQLVAVLYGQLQKAAHDSSGPIMVVSHRESSLSMHTPSAIGWALYDYAGCAVGLKRVRTDATQRYAESVCGCIWNGLGDFGTGDKLAKQLATLRTHLSTTLGVLANKEARKNYVDCICGVFGEAGGDVVEQVWGGLLELTVPELVAVYRAACTRVAPHVEIHETTDAENWVCTSRYVAEGDKAVTRAVYVRDEAMIPLTTCMEIWKNPAKSRLSENFTALYKEGWHYDKIKHMPRPVRRVVHGGAEGCKCALERAERVRGSSVYQGLAYVLLRMQKKIAYGYAKMSTSDVRALMWVRHGVCDEIGHELVDFDAAYDLWPTGRTAEEMRRVCTSIMTVCGITAHAVEIVYHGLGVPSSPMTIGSGQTVAWCCGHREVFDDKSVMFDGTVVPYYDKYVPEKVPLVVQRTRAPSVKKGVTLQTRVVAALRDRLCRP